MLESIADVLVRRDGYERDEAEDTVAHVKEEILYMLDNKYSLFEVENFIQSELGLEPDYILELLP